MGNDQHFVNYSSSFSMKKFFLIIFISISCIITANSFFKTSSEDPVAVPPSKQRTGDADKGYEYLITGDYIKSGIPAHCSGWFTKRIHNIPSTGKASIKISNTSLLQSKH